jgi:hypothetical protein
MHCAPACRQAAQPSHSEAPLSKRM